MSVTPQIITYRSDDAPPHQRWLARFPSGGPEVFFGRTKEDAVLSAERWLREAFAQARAVQAARIVGRRLLR